MFNRCFALPLGQLCGLLRSPGIFGLMIFSIVAPSLKAADSTNSAKLDTQFAVAGDTATGWKNLLASAPTELRPSLVFLLENMPEQDLKSLKPEFILKNVRLAHEARKATPWASAVPLELFHEQVLPYASINERRDDWREDFMNRFLPMVKELKSAEDAVAKLNIEVFKTFDVKYHATKRPKPDQSPFESIEAKFASCTGLSILLIDACRAVGIPARFVGTPSWTTVRGNHSWVEVFTNQWRFVGACEPSRLDETWFLGNAAKADESKPMNRIYATSYLKTQTHFPLIWNRELKWIAAEDVTRWYTKRRMLKVASADADGQKSLQIRLDGRLVAASPLEKNMEFDLAGGRSYEWQLVDGSGKIARSGKLEMPDSNSQLKID
jgi:Transglutaminase-like superfamily